MRFPQSELWSKFNCRIWCFTENFNGPYSPYELLLRDIFPNKSSKNRVVNGNSLIWKLPRQTNEKMCFTEVNWVIMASPGAREAGSGSSESEPDSGSDYWLMMADDWMKYRNAKIKIVFEHGIGGTAHLARQNKRLSWLVVWLFASWVLFFTTATGAARAPGNPRAPRHLRAGPRPSDLLL